ncbi:MAG TPA: DUF3107 domain-containing protein [Acidimicrobiales bacterium]|jgi:hypothetical protein|nr:DUF3107 domain-containing protein [Acidimicrobiales bacterium]
MDVRIGVTYSPKEIIVELADDADRDALKTQVDKALGDDDGVLWLADRRGRDVAVPSSKVAYVEIGASGGPKHIGFGAS